MLNEGIIQLFNCFGQTIWRLETGKSQLSGTDKQVLVRSNTTQEVRYKITTQLETLTKLNSFFMTN